MISAVLKNTVGVPKSKGLKVELFTGLVLTLDEISANHNALGIEVRRHIVRSSSLLL